MTQKPKDLFEKKWLKGVDLRKYDEDTQVILMMFCRYGRKWRTEQRLAERTRVPVERVAEILEGLRREGLVTMSLNKNKELIYGLTSRVAED
jgi:hypothetical protein